MKDQVYERLFVLELWEVYAVDEEYFVLHQVGPFPDNRTLVRTVILSVTRAASDEAISVCGAPAVDDLVVILIAIYATVEKWSPRILSLCSAVLAFVLQLLAILDHVWRTPGFLLVIYGGTRVLNGNCRVNDFLVVG